ncbi:MAG: MMPL family transporter [Lachnospiraceae bacterium]|nr:MMPL family transporter [Lachnospiraceae bacterium]
MEEKNKKMDANAIMEKIASIIVNKRKAFLVFFGLAFIYCLLSISRVSVNDDLTDYLPDTTETRMGLDIMDAQFTTFGTAKIMINNIDYDTALSISKTLQEINGVSDVTFYDPEDEDYSEEDIPDSYNNFAAVYTIDFEDAEDTEITQSAMAEVRALVSKYDVSVYSTVDKDDSASLQEDMKLILVLVVIIITGVLIFTSQTYMEIVVFMLTFLVAIILNMGTNYWFGEISFVTNAVGVVLQIALAIDYAIILFHRFMEEHEDKEAKEALIIALSKAIPEISSSSLTTMAGMAALMTMQFGIGMDLGRVLLKSIIFSMISVFVFMPAMIMIFEKGIMKTMHKNFVPKISAWGHIVVKLRHVIVLGFLIVVFLGIIFSNQCPYIYDKNSIDSAKKDEYLTAKDEIEKYFNLTNTMAIIVPKGDYQEEAMILKEVAKCDGVDKTLGLANIEVGDDQEYVLTDSLTPRELAEVADTDIDITKMLYQFYAFKNEQYGAYLGGIDSYKVPIIDMIDFIYDQEENGGLELNSDTTRDIEDIHKDITDARKQLEGEDFSRLVFTWNKPLEGKETFDEIDQIRNIALKYYDKVYVVGDSTSDYDLSKSFKTDNMKISILTALMVGIILLFTFQSAGLPFLLVLTIQGSIWVNFSIPYLKNEPMFFLSYLIVSSIQMGATIDYAIVITSRHLALREELTDRREIITEMLNQAFPTVITSGGIMASAAFIIGRMTSNGTIASLGNTLGIGVLISIFMVMAVLPAMLYIFDWFIDMTNFSKGSDERMRMIKEKKAMIIEGSAKRSEKRRQGRITMKENVLNRKEAKHDEK